MLRELDPAGVDNLRIAVVEQATKDYLKALVCIRDAHRAVLRGKPITRTALAGARVMSDLYTVVECENFFENYMAIWFDPKKVDGLAVRDEIRRQSGINVEVLKELTKRYKEGNANESET